MEGQPVQKVAPEGSESRWWIYGALAETPLKERWRASAAADAQRPFDKVGQGPVTPSQFAEVGRAGHVLLLNVHHMHVFNSRWWGVLALELSVLYAAAYGRGRSRRWGSWRKFSMGILHVAGWSGCRGRCWKGK